MAERPLHAFDTSVVVAALLGWHEHHAPALHALQHAFDKARVLLPGPVLVEAYSAMTRLPAPHRIAPADALTLMQDTFASAASVVALAGGELWRFIRSLPDAQVSGGRAYDAHILACAEKAGASVLWTFNEADFVAIERAEVEIRRP